MTKRRAKPKSQPRPPMTKRQEATDLLRLMCHLWWAARDEHRRANRLYEGRWCYEQRRAWRLLEAAAELWEQRKALMKEPSV